MSNAQSQVRAQGYAQKCRPTQTQGNEPSLLYLLYKLLLCSEELFSKNMNVTTLMFLCLAI